MYEFAVNRLKNARNLMYRQSVPEAIELFQSLLKFITDVAERQEILCEIDYAFLIVGQDEDANALWNFERVVSPINITTLELLIASAIRAGRYGIALQRIASVRGIVQVEKLLLREITCRIGQFENEKATALMESDPLIPASFVDQFRFQTLISEKRNKEILDLIPTTRKNRSADLLKIRIHALAGCGHFETVETELAAHEEYYPEQTWISHTLAQNAAAAKWRDLAVYRWGNLIQSTQQNNEVLNEFITALINNVEIDRAQRVLADNAGYHSPSTVAELQSKLFVVKGELDLASQTLAAGIEQATGKANFSAVSRLWAAHSALAMRRFSATGDRNWLEEHLVSAQAAHNVAPELYQPRIKLIDALIRNDETERALGEIENIPKNNRPETLRLAMWRHDLHGDTDAARKVWNLRRRIHYLPQLENGPKANLERLDDNPLPPSDALTLYTVIKDERKRLPWFFAHYRKLGVKSFVFVDNGSTDESIAYLRAQPDVIIFHTEDSYVAAMAGMVWVNHLKNRLSANGWALYVDVDEGLVFDGSEERTIHDLIAVLEERGDEAMTGFMLDMYADRKVENATIDDGTDFIARHPNYLNIHFSTPAPVSPYKNIRGGARIIFGTGEELTKTPLVKVSAGIDFLRSSHNITPAQISKITCVLLHFKLIDGLEAEAEAVLSDLKRSADCQIRYLRYLTDGNIHNLLEQFVDDCRIYDGSETLIELDLMTAIEEFDAL